MTKFKIDFRQQRDFGEVLNATFAFLRLNVGKLGKALLYYVCPFLIIQGIARVYYDTSLGELTGIMFRHGMDLFFAIYYCCCNASSDNFFKQHDGKPDRILLYQGIC